MAAWLLASISAVFLLVLGRYAIRWQQMLSELSRRHEKRGDAAAQFVGPATGYPMARCLDGSPGLYYLSQGYGSGFSKFLIFHEGGGFCSSDADCLQRSSTSLGTTAKDPATMNFGSLNQLKLSRSSGENPLMYNWNHVFFRYCDGGYFSGEAADPVSVGGSEIYFRGKHITEAVFKDLDRFGFSNATDVVISGCSAGAIRVFAHLDALRELITPSAKVAGLPDSGFYMDMEIFTPLKRYVVTRQSATSLLNDACAREHAGQLEKCLIGSVVAGLLSTPVFALQSRFDLDQRGCEMGARCRASEACVTEYARNLTAAMQGSLRQPQKGFFLDSCPRHCSYGDRPLDDASGLTQLQAFARWYGGGASEYGQQTLYSCDQCCHGRS